jgi:hypothetical protein
LELDSSEWTQPSENEETEHTHLSKVGGGEDWSENFALLSVLFS